MRSLTPDQIGIITPYDAQKKKIIYELMLYAKVSFSIAPHAQGWACNQLEMQKGVRFVPGHQWKFGHFGFARLIQNGLIFSLNNPSETA